MHYAFPPDVRQLITQQLESGRYASEDDVLRDALRVLQDVDNDTVSIQAAIDEWNAGDEGMALDEAFSWVREEFQRKLPG
ncbi:MAG: type II toxin-antitoxin system ParD family antitoxin [Pirellulaceae bacterium]